MQSQLFPLNEANRTDVEILLDAAFGPDRHARTAYRLREGQSEIAELSFGLSFKDMLVGSIQCWQVQLREKDGAVTKIILLGPVAISPSYQKMGFGRKLMLATLSAALDSDDPPMVLIGDAEYYGLFGFSAEATAGWQLPGPWDPHRLLARNPSGQILPQFALLERSDAL